MQRLWSSTLTDEPKRRFSIRRVPSEDGPTHRLASMPSADGTTSSSYPMRVASRLPRPMWASILEDKNMPIIMFGRGAGQTYKRRKGKRNKKARDAHECTCKSSRSHATTHVVICEASSSCVLQHTRLARSRHDTLSNIAKHNLCLSGRCSGMLLELASCLSRRLAWTTE